MRTAVIKHYKYVVADSWEKLFEISKNGLPFPDLSVYSDIIFEVRETESVSSPLIARLRLGEGIKTFENDGNKYILIELPAAVTAEMRRSKYRYSFRFLMADQTTPKTYLTGDLIGIKQPGKLNQEQND